MEEENNDSANFLSATHGEVGVEEMISIIRDFLEVNPKDDYSLVIGTDSQTRNDTKKKGNGNRISLVTAVTIHRKGHGGKYFWRRHVVDGIHTLRDKIYKETLTSLAFASSFVPTLKKTLNGHSPRLEIHVDVGERGETRDMLREVVGMVTGSGFVAKIKPDSYGASHVADKHA